MARDITFGPAGDQWHYERSSKTYDLTRGASKQFTVATTSGPAGTSITIDPAVTALVVVDMQNYFLDPKIRDHPTGLKAVDRTLSMINKSRKLDIQVIWLNWGLTEDDLAQMPAAVSRGFSRSLIEQAPVGAPRRGLGADLGDGMGRTLMAGSWNAELYPPLVAASSAGRDVHCAKNRMSGLWTESQPLRRHLEASGKRTLLFAGVNTDQCVLGTLTDAYSAGWDCVMLEDCCATVSSGAHDVCIQNVAGSYGFVVDSKSFLAGKLVEAEASSNAEAAQRPIPNADW